MRRAAVGPGKLCGATVLAPFQTHHGNGLTGTAFRLGSRHFAHFKTEHDILEDRHVGNSA